jgi:hypothetical protein
VEFTDKDPAMVGQSTASLIGTVGEKFTESNMNPNLKGRDMRKAFDSDDYQVMIVANKFQTGFDQPKLCARNLRPMLRETLLDEDDIDLGNVVLSHYRVAKIRQQDLVLKENTPEYKLEPGEGLGTAKPKDRQEEYLLQIINRLNEVSPTSSPTRTW